MALYTLIATPCERGTFRFNAIHEVACFGAFYGTHKHSTHMFMLRAFWRSNIQIAFQYY